MKYYCQNCKRETEGFIITIKGNSDVKCIECQSYTPYSKVKPEAPIVIYKCKGFHDTDYA